jgi:hypothetical protein
MANTEIIVILDRSGSMESVRGDTIGGFNSFLADQQKLPDAARITLVQFDDRYEKLYEGRLITDAPRLDEKSFEPRGSTALLDAIARTILEQGERFSKAADGEKPQQVVVAILTDGFENASHQFSRAQVFALISQQRDQWGWIFYFLGANQDAIAEAGRLAVGAGQALTYASNARGTAGAFSSLGRAVAHSRRTGRAHDYDAEDRDKSKPN